ncbi:MAG: Gfo/Idh/MocA family oxidoreductase, partial [Planctomycetes bacterium]|nr:Gfo/Idh/MocA family oxidoreductase [Planctomycetota bacterium]
MRRVPHKPTTDVPPLTRRGFLRAAGAVAGAAVAPWILSAAARGADGAVAPAGRITVGLIGIGAMGRGHLGRLVADPIIRLAAVCDVDRLRRDDAKRGTEEAYAAAAGGAYRGCAAYNDYRELLARPDIDAVVIATPDHWHAVQSIDAARAGKDVYCEKPVSLTIDEGRRLVETVRRGGRVFQTGTQYRSNPTIRRVCDFVRAGGLGRVRAAFTLWQKVTVEGLGSSYAPLGAV